MIIAILVNILICFIIALLSGWITRKNLNPWYIELRKPRFNPPKWLFGPVWTLLYIIISIAGGVLWMHREAQPAALVLYIAQLLLNLSWSFIFFGAHRLFGAFINLTLLWFTIASIMVLTFSTIPFVFWAFIPYIVWISFAWFINFTVWRLNHQSK